MKRILLGTLAALLVVEAWGLWTLTRHGALARFDPVPPERFSRIGVDGAPRPRPDAAFLASVLPDTVRGVGEILRWTMDRTDSIGDPGPGTSAAEAYRVAASGGGLVCGPLARLFVTALSARGHAAREVQLARSLFSAGDTHITVEVRVDGRWVVYDPTFHVSFARGGRLLGAAEIHRALVEGDGDAVEPRFHGPVAYPARLERYDVGWLALYNHVIIYEAGGATLPEKLPPVRYWTGPRWRVLALEGGGPPLWQVGVARDAYLLFIVLLPGTLALVAAVLALGGRGRRRAGS